MTRIGAQRTAGAWAVGADTAFRATAPAAADAVPPSADAHVAPASIESGAAASKLSRSPGVGGQDTPASPMTPGSIPVPATPPVD